MTSTGTSSARRRSLSLATRIFLVSSLLVVLAVGLAVTVTSLLAGRIARRAADEALKTSSSVQTAFEGQRYERLRLLSRLFAADPSFAAYVAEASGQHDARSILDLLSERRKDLGYDFAMVLDPAGHVIARTDRAQAAGDDLSKRPLVARALADYEAAGVWQEGGDLYYSVAVPISKDTLIGYLVTGFAINDVAALEVNKISGADVAFVAKVDGQPTIVASNLDRETAESLTATLRDQKSMMARVMVNGESVPREELSVRGETWIALLAPLKDAAGHVVAATVALVSLPNQLAAYREIQGALLASGLLSVLLACVLSYAFARQSLAPMRRLAAAAEAARQGDYDQAIAVDRSDEVGRLSRAFDELLSDLREKRDMEAYLTELSKNLPEPAQGRSFVGAPQSREALVVGITLRGYGRARSGSAPPAPGTPDPATRALERLGAEWKRLAGAVTAGRGQVEGICGQRLVARFEGEGRALRALALAAEAANGEAAAPDGLDLPIVAMAAGRVTVGPVSWGEQAERTMVGLPVEQLESLEREATAGEIVVSREVFEELRPSLERAGYHLAPRRALIAPQPLYVLSAALAARVVETAGGALAATPAGRSAAAAAATLSGIEPGALMAHRFEILSVLGAGGMGVVYKARDRELDDLVALKMLKRELWGDPAQLERLKSELKLARKITHPNVLRTYDFGEINGIPFISMEYVRGVTLRFLLDQTHRLPYSAGLRLAKQLCAGLGVAHAAGVLHRDIKPENLILEPTGNAKLMDFGIARPLERTAAGQTQAGFVVGTPQYLSPEQLQGREPDARADIYSCGVVFYEVFTGKLPFEAPTDVELLMKHLKEAPLPPAEHWPEIPPRLQEIVLRCLKKDPAERYPSADDLHRAFDELSA
ncbi:MAG TPA: protein kinase [Thermoanaerobaculia bacterium]